MKEVCEIGSVKCAVERDDGKCWSTWEVSEQELRECDVAECITYIYVSRYRIFTAMCSVC